MAIFEKNVNRLSRVGSGLGAAMLVVTMGLVVANIGFRFFWPCHSRNI